MSVTQRSLGQFETPAARPRVEISWYRAARSFRPDTFGDDMETTAIESDTALFEVILKRLNAPRFVDADEVLGLNQSA